MTGAQPEAARSVRIPYSLAGDTLEGKLRVFARHARHPHRGLILLHPLSTLGGSMNDAVLAELWRAGEYVPMSMRREDASAGSLGTMRLRPEDDAGKNGT